MQSSHFYISVADYQILLNGYYTHLQSVSQRDAAHFLKVSNEAIKLMEGYLLRGEIAQATIFYQETVTLLNEAYKEIAVRVAAVQKLRFPIDLFTGRAVSRIADVSDPLKGWRVSYLDPFLSKWGLPKRG